MEIKILGPGCVNCVKMEERVKAAVKELGIDASVEAVSDIREIMRHTMTTPGLVIDGKLRHAGKPLPGMEKIKAFLTEKM
jgi:small redox-active disulfide protein 2